MDLPYSPAADRNRDPILAALRPLLGKDDLIIDAGTVDDHHRSTAERVAAQTGIPYVLVDGRLTPDPKTGGPRVWKRSGGGGSAR